MTDLNRPFVNSIEIKNLANLGLQHKTKIDFHAPVTVLYGNNGAGKTGIANALRATLCGVEDPAGYGASKLSSYINSEANANTCHAELTFADGSKRKWVPAQGLVDTNNSDGEPPRLYNKASTGINDPLLFTKESETHPYWSEIFSQKVTREGILEHARQSITTTASKARADYILPVLDELSPEIIRQEQKVADYAHEELLVTVREFQTQSESQLKAPHKMMDFAENFYSGKSVTAQELEILRTEIADTAKEITRLHSLDGIAVDAKEQMVKESERLYNSRLADQAAFESGADKLINETLPKQIADANTRINELQQKIAEANARRPVQDASHGQSLHCPHCQGRVTLTASGLVIEPTAEEREAISLENARINEQIDRAVTGFTADLNDAISIRDEGQLELGKVTQLRESHKQMVAESANVVEHTKSLSIREGDTDKNIAKVKELEAKLDSLNLQLEQADNAHVLSKKQGLLFYIAAKAWALESIKFSASPKGAIADYNKSIADAINQTIAKVYERGKVKLPVPQMTMPNFIFEVAGRSPHTMSGGEKWFARTAIQLAIAAMGKSPAVVVLDAADILDKSRLPKLWKLLAHITNSLEQVSVIACVTLSKEEFIHSCKGDTNFENLLVGQPVPGENSDV